VTLSPLLVKVLKRLTTSTLCLSDLLHHKMIKKISWPNPYVKLPATHYGCSITCSFPNSIVSMSSPPRFGPIAAWMGQNLDQSQPRQLAAPCLTLSIVSCKLDAKWLFALLFCSEFCKCTRQTIITQCRIYSY